MDRRQAVDMVKGALVAVFAILCAYAVDDYVTTRTLTRRTAQAVLMILDMQEAECQQMRGMYAR